jgi:hypothetical protein
MNEMVNRIRKRADRPALDAAAVLDHEWRGLKPPAQFFCFAAIMRRGLKPPAQFFCFAAIMRRGQTPLRRDPMPLSKAKPRRHLHTREIQCRGYLRDDGLWDIEGSITDVKSYTPAKNAEEGGKVAGEPIHHMLARLTVDNDLNVVEAEVTTEAGPHSICGDVAPNYQNLVGLRIKAGWRHAVLEKLGGAHGCTHITDILVGPLAVTALKTVNRWLNPDPEKNYDPAVRPKLLDTCYALRGDRPVAEHRWPEYYRSE